jgi:hypothetical protein
MDSCTLVGLLDHHSNIDVRLLCALACTSRTLREEVDLCWGARHAAYVASLADAAPKRPPGRLPNELERAGFSSMPLQVSCEYRIMYDTEPDPNDEPEIGDIRQRFRDVGSCRSSLTSAMSGKTARDYYFLDTADLKLLSQYIGTSDQCKWYMFEDVLEAAILKAGSPAAFRNLMKVRLLKDVKTSQLLARQNKQITDLMVYLSPRDSPNAADIWIYAHVFLSSGVGFKEVRARLSAHMVFLIRVRVKLHSLHPDMPISALEIERVAHLRSGYTMCDRQLTFVDDAVRMIMSMRGFNVKW